MTFPPSVVPAYRREFFFEIFKIEKFFQKWIPHPVLRGACPQKHVWFFQKKNSSFLPFVAQNFFLNFFSQNQKIPAYLNPRPRNGGRSLRFGLKFDFYPRLRGWGWGLLKGYSPGWGNKIWCKPKVVPIKGYYLGDEETSPTAADEATEGPDCLGFSHHAIGAFFRQRSWWWLSSPGLEAAFCTELHPDMRLRGKDVCCPWKKRSPETELIPNSVAC